MLKSICAACAALFLLAGCSGARDNLDAARPVGGGDPAKTLSAFALGDLAAALADARAAGDSVAANCWAALMPLVQRHAAGGSSAAPAGAFAAFQKARNLRRAASRGLPDEVGTACAPVVLDAEATIARLGLIAAPGGGLLGGLLR